MTDLDWSAAAAEAREALADWPATGPGGVVLGVRGGTEQFCAATGTGGAGRAALNVDTVFRWASISKHVLAACLLESGALPLDLRLGEVLPELAPAPAAVTVAQALAMQGGLPDTRESLTLLGVGTEDRTGAAELLEWSARIGRLNAPPGAEVVYSNGGYRLLEAALARRGHVFADMVASHARRLDIGMRALEYWTDPVPGLVPGHIPDTQGGWSEGFQGMHLSAAGSLCGSARDLARWLGDLMTRGIFDTMRRPPPLASNEIPHYGLGLQLTDIGGVSVSGHGGAQPGYRTGFLCAPDARAALIVLCNRDDGDATGLLARIWRRLVGDTEIPRPAGDWAPPGLYAAPQGDLWAEVRRDGIVVRDAEHALFQGVDGWAVCDTPQSRMRLRAEDAGLIGTLFHRPVRLLPVTPRPPHEDPMLDGTWESDGAMFRIRGDRVFWGIGPTQRSSAMTPLGNARWLFDASNRRIHLSRLAPDRLGLALARSRVIEYRRL